MKIREIFHDENRVFKMLPPWAKTLIKHVHDIQEKIDILMAAYETTKTQVAVNTAYTNKKKYITPYGDFSTYSAAAKAEPIDGQGEPIKWTVIRRKIKDETESAYYLNV